jgi:hypothetical protein
VSQRRLPLRPGFDLVVVIHPKQLPAKTELLAKELFTLCHRAGATP